MVLMHATHWYTLNEARERIRAGTLSAAELWEACAYQIDLLNPQLNAFITLMQPELASGAPASPAALAGIPIAVKDLFETAGVRTTAGSLFFKDYVPDRDAAVVEKVRAAGGQIIGKTNTHEIALGVTTVNPHFGTCRNPWDRRRVAGGSSGGSAVAVATGMAVAALGTDTGGSIRIPASLCGVVGLKPTFGRVSLRGVIPLSKNLDHAGPLARTVSDAALLLQVIADGGSEDPRHEHAPADDYVRHIDDGVRGWRVLCASGAYVEKCEPDVIEAVAQSTKVFEKNGAKITRVDLSYLRDAALANGIMTQADAAAYHRERLAEHPEWFGDDVRRRLETGRDTSTVDYQAAAQTQIDMRRRLSLLLQDFDVILLPSTAMTAPPINEGDAVEHARRLTRFTAPFNLVGLPAISIPCGFNRQGLPIGLQLVAEAWKEAQLLRAARSYERETEWASRHPDGG